MLKVRILRFSTTYMQVYLRPKIFLLGSSLAFNLKKGPVRCAKVCDKSWVILLMLSKQFKNIGFARQSSLEDRS